MRDDSDEKSPLLVAAEELRDIQLRQHELESRQFELERVDMWLSLLAKPVAKPKLRLLRGGKSKDAGVDNPQSTDAA